MDVSDWLAEMAAPSLQQLSNSLYLVPRCSPQSRLPKFLGPSSAGAAPVLVQSLVQTSAAAPPLTNHTSRPPSAQMPLKMPPLGLHKIN